METASYQQQKREIDAAEARDRLLILGASATPMVIAVLWFLYVDEQFPGPSPSKKASPGSALPAAADTRRRAFEDPVLTLDPALSCALSRPY
eukprot:CAMPEP_0119260602 /NCGR_PEP_ID=MMETSP1329-20130426/907_1 /TAXON_ID=114041 /ORGANISM="Genus nov. species nov., Strain RCC1024" /LENGTH=91 /DNA_ID=CAMNT_0007260027 /DNA_START=139 /DNA_END=416 /DNA_ORIENTATION=+